jgi:O-antigen ligase
MKKDALALFVQHPIMGIGLNNFKYTARFGTYAHSDVYELPCCLGIVGTVLYYVPAGILLVLSFRHWKRNLPNAVVPFAITVSYIINEFSNVSYFYYMIHAFVGISRVWRFITSKSSSGRRLKRAKIALGTAKMKVRKENDYHDCNRI